MKRKFFSTWALFGCLVLAASAPVLAHHGTAAYDLDKVVALQATITNFYWMNPHSEILFDSQDRHGNLQHWAIETHPPTMLEGHGWTRKALAPGDHVMITFHPAKNGGTTGILIKVVLPNGQELKHDV